MDALIAGALRRGFPEAAFALKFAVFPGGSYVSEGLRRHFLN